MVPIGEGVFETLRVVDSRPHALARHLERLQQAASRLGLEVPDPVDVRRRVAAHLQEAPLPYGRMRLTWVATENGAVLSMESVPTPPPHDVVSLTVSDWQVPQKGPLTGIKSTDYVNYLAALHHAQERGFDEALLVNSAGALCEATTANVFFVLDGQLCTPARSTGCLPGIARGLIIDLCDVAAVDVPVDALTDASEVFLTSSLRAVQPVVRIDQRDYPELGAVTAEAQDAWRRLAEQSWDPPPSLAEYENDDRVR